MPQIFGRGAHAVLRLLPPVLVAGAILAFVIDQAWVRAAGWSNVGKPIVQPVQFSHEHHVGLIGLDCRYCHTTVETSPFAGIPATSVCMNCHSLVWLDSPMLAPVRASLASGRPLQWNRVHALPDFVFFDHRIHVHAGVACVTCHGRVDRMPQIAQMHTLHMQWCLDCHRHPDRDRVARDRVFDPRAGSPSDVVTAAWGAARGGGARGAATTGPPPLDIGRSLLTRCNTCHR